MVRHAWVGRRFILGVKFDTRDHLIGIDLLTDRSEDAERVFTLLIGVPFLGLKLSVRTHPPGLRGVVTDGSV